MKGFYDRQVPNQLLKIAKRLDPNAKIGTSQLQVDNHEVIKRHDGRFEAVERGEGDTNGPGFATADEAFQHSNRLNQKTVPSLEITPLMRQQILKGLPQYRRGGRVGFQHGGGTDAFPERPETLAST